MPYILMTYHQAFNLIGILEDSEIGLFECDRALLKDLQSMNIRVHDCERPGCPGVFIPEANRPAGQRGRRKFCCAECKRIVANERKRK